MAKKEGKTGKTTAHAQQTVQLRPGETLVVALGKHAIRGITPHLMLCSVADELGYTVRLTTFPAAMRIHPEGYNQITVRSDHDKK